MLFFQVHPDGKKEKKNMKAAMARLASSENLTNSYDLVLGLVRRPQHSPPRPCRHNTPSTPPPSRHHHCACHAHHHCSSSRDRDRHSSTKERESRRQSRSRPSSPSPSSRPSPSLRQRSRSRPSSPAQSQPQTQTQSKSKWLFSKKAKRSASADREKVRGTVELGWDDMRPSVTGQWEDTGNNGWSNSYHDRSSDSESAATTAQLAGDLCRRATALRRTLYKLPGLINMRSDFLEIIK